MYVHPMTSTTHISPPTFLLTPLPSPPILPTPPTGNYVKKGIKKEYKTDMSVVPNLVNLFKHLYGTLAVRTGTFSHLIPAPFN